MTRFNTERKTSKVFAKIEPSIKEKFVQLAESKGVTTSEYLRALICEEIVREENSSGEMKQAK